MVATDSRSKECSWENRSTVGLVGAFWVTLKEVLLNTSNFFGGLPRPGSYWDPVLFALIAAGIGVLGAQVGAELKDWAIGDMKYPYSIRMQMVVADMKLLPLVCKTASVVVAQSILEVLTCHLTMKRLCPYYQGLQATWRVFFYALGATEVLCVLPFVGSAFAGVWRPIVLALGFSAAHRAEMYIAVAGVLAITAIGVILKIAVSLEGLLLNIGNAGGYDYLWRFLLSNF